MTEVCECFSQLFHLRPAPSGGVVGIHLKAVRTVDTGAPWFGHFLYFLFPSNKVWDKGKTIKWLLSPAPQNILNEGERSRELLSVSLFSFKAEKS